MPQWDGRQVGPETLKASGSPGCSQPALIWGMVIDGGGRGCFLWVRSDFLWILPWIESSCGSCGSDSALLGL